MELQNLYRGLQPLTPDAGALACVEEITDIPMVSSTDASTAIGLTNCYGVDKDADLVGFEWASATSVASDASNYATFTLVKYDVTGTISTTVATIATSTAAHSVSACTTHGGDLVTSQVQLNEGESLRAKVAKAGTGVSTGAGTLRVRLRRRDTV